MRQHCVHVNMLMLFMLFMQAPGPRLQAGPGPETALGNSAMAIVEPKNSDGSAAGVKSNDWPMDVKPDVNVADVGHRVGDASHRPGPAACGTAQCLAGLSLISRPAKCTP